MHDAASPKIKTMADVFELEKTALEDRELPSSTYEVLQQSAIAYGERKALSFLLQGVSADHEFGFSYAQLFKKVNQVANALNYLGVSKTDTISMMLPNLPQTHFTVWGAEAAGIFNPINPLLEVEHIAAIMNEARTKVLVTLAPFPGTELWQKAQKLQELVPSLEVILAVDLAKFLPPPMAAGMTAGRQEYLSKQVMDFDEFVAPFEDRMLLSGRVIHADDVASYFHTGGTTGTPKLAPHTHRAEVVMAWQMAAGLDLNSSDVALCGLPLFHVNAVFVTGLAPWMVGAQVLLATPQGYRNANVIKNFWGLVDRFKVSYFSSVPTILSSLLEVPTGDADISSLKFCLCGAAPLAVELAKNFEAKTGLVLIEGYGQTEGTCATSGNPLYGERRIGSVGLRMAYTQVRIVSIDAEGRAIGDCATGEVGVIAIKGPTVFNGYKQAEHNNGLWVDDGWFNTGDLGRLDEDGYLWLTGRSKDLIIRGGHNIDPQMIEEALHKHPDVVEVAAVGRPDARVGEVPVAFVRIKSGSLLNSDSLMKFAEANIQERAAVPKEILFIENMPLTAVGKIFKPELRNRLICQVVENELASFDDSLNFKVRVIADKVHGQVALIEAQDTDAIGRAAESALANFNFKFQVIATR
ncbi:acyl-CoA synthetase [Pseudomonas sp. BGr12]|uniref:acyl-CoA synthetase n=1 Tax=Pseudomonas sp. BGr12 TaxID=2936269 RepID=UPI0025597DDD|nr:acyl-CoA synthetase [Pseudomonas sp. BJa5]MDL2426293.1 acyl-CoA synthetase [Pseudomonas sp. BJa5]